MVGFLHIKRLERRNKTHLYRLMALSDVCKIDVLKDFTKFAGKH